MEQPPTLTLSSFEKLIEELRKYPEIVNELRKNAKKAKEEKPREVPEKDRRVSFTVRFN